MVAKIRRDSLRAKAQKLDGRRAGGVFEDTHGNDYLLKNGLEGGFLRFYGEPRCMEYEERFIWQEPEDKGVHQSISAIWEVMFSDMFRELMPSRVPEYQIHHNQADLVGEADYVVCTKLVSNLESITQRLFVSKSDYAGDRIEGYGTVSLASLFFGDIDSMPNLGNIGFVEQSDGSLMAQRIDFSYSGWFDKGKIFGTDDIADFMVKYTAKDFEVHPAYGCAEPALFAHSEMPANEEQKALKHIATFDSGKFNEIWAEYKPLLQEQIAKLSDPQIRERMKDLVDQDFVPKVLEERQACLRQKLGLENGKKTSPIEDNISAQLERPSSEIDTGEMRAALDQKQLSVTDSNIPH